MSLTKTDLKSIKGIVTEATGELESKMDKKLVSLESRMDQKFDALQFNITASEKRTHKLIKSEILNLRTEIVNKLDQNYLTRYDAAEYEERFRMIKFRIDELDNDVRKLKGKVAQA